MSLTAILAVAACSKRVEPVYNVVDHPIPVLAQKLPLSDIERNIMIAGTYRHWVCEPVKPGELHATFSSGQHKAVLDVTYTTQAYSIRMDHVENLKQKDDEIHRTYNKWVRNFEKDIEDQLMRAGLGAK